MEDGAPVLNRRHATRREGSTVACAIHLVEDRRADFARPQEIGVERVGCSVLDGPTGGHQRLGEDLAAEHARRRHLRAASAEEIDFEILEVEELEEIIESFGHADETYPSRTGDTLWPMPGELWAAMAEDWAAVSRNDPAARDRWEAALGHTALHAIWAHRVAHRLHEAGFRRAARAVAAIAHAWSGVEIHPGARIGRRFFIDHGSGVVIGETAEIGDDCVLFHNVTLGGTGKHQGKRHPTLLDRVYVGTGATLLGPIRIGENVRIGAGSFIRMRDVPANCTAVGTPARIVKRDGQRVEAELPRTRLPDEAIPVSIPNERDAPEAREA